MACVGEDLYAFVRKSGRKHMRCKQLRQGGRISMVTYVNTGNSTSRFGQGQWNLLDASARSMPPWLSLVLKTRDSRLTRERRPRLHDEASRASCYCACSTCSRHSPWANWLRALASLSHRLSVTRLARNSCLSMFRTALPRSSRLTNAACAGSHASCAYKSPPHAATRQVKSYDT